MEASFLYLLAVLALAWSAGLAANKLGYPSVLGELAAGIICGPALLGAMGIGFSEPIPGLEILAQVGIFALMLFIGMEVDYRDLIRNGRAGALAAVGGFVIPFAAGYFVAVWEGYSQSGGLFLGMAMAVTSLATKSRILVDLNLFGTRIANVLLSGALLSDVGALLVFALIVGFSGAEAAENSSIISVIIWATVYFVLATIIGLKVLPAAGAFLQKKKLTDRSGTFTFVVLVGLVYAEGAHLLGLHPIIGAFLAGAFLRQGVLKQRLSLEIAHVVRDMAVGFLAPIFFFTAGFHVRLNVVFDEPLLVILVLLVAAISKIVGTALLYAFSGNGWREGIVIGAGMNGRGAVEIIVAEIALGMGLITQSLFSVLVLMAFFTTMTVPIALKMGVRWLESRDELVRNDDARRGMIIVGATPLGRLIARLASKETEETVCLIDSNPRRCLLARKEQLPVVRGNALREEVMIFAGARDAATVAALTPNNDINQLVCRFAKEHFGVPWAAQGWPEVIAGPGGEGQSTNTLWAGANVEVEQRLWEHRAERHPDEVESVLLEGHLDGPRLAGDFLEDRTRLPLLIIREGRALLPTISRLKPTDKLMFLKRPKSRVELTTQFQEAVRKAPVLDFKEKTSFPQFLKDASQALAPHTPEDPQALYEMFEAREKEFSSVLVPGLAIPHVALPGSRPLLVLLGRAKEGVVFPGHPAPVHAVFLLVGGEKDRDTHLHALASIARSVSSHGFELTWQAAPDEDALRQLMLVEQVEDEYEEELQS